MPEEVFGEGKPPAFLTHELRALRVVSSEPVPKKLFACSAKVREDVATALRARFGRGAELRDDLASWYGKHLSYSNGLGDKFYEAGPSADFTEILYVYGTETLDEARQLLRNDPFYVEGIVGSEWFFEWHIHAPLYKSNGDLPPLPGKEVEIEMAVTTPETLIASIGSLDFDLEPLRAWREGKSAQPLFDLLHVYNMHGEGGLSSMGIAWACGPAGDDWKHALHIFATPTIEMAKSYNDNDAMCRWGLAKDFRYFEWCIHYPLRKATPRHKEILRSLVSSADAR